MEGTYVPKQGWRLAEGRTHPEIWMPKICIFWKQVTFSNGYLSGQFFFLRLQVKSDCRISNSFRFFPRCSKSNNLEMTVLLNKAWIQGCSPPRIPGTTRIITFFWVWVPYKPLFHCYGVEGSIPKVWPHCHRGLIKFHHVPGVSQSVHTTICEIGAGNRCELEDKQATMVAENLVSLRDTT